MPTDADADPTTAERRRLLLAEIRHVTGLVRDARVCGLVDLHARRRERLDGASGAGRRRQGGLSA